MNVKEKRLRKSGANFVKNTLNLPMYHSQKKDAAKVASKTFVKGTSMIKENQKKASSYKTKMLQRQVMHQQLGRYVKQL